MANLNVDQWQTFDFATLNATNLANNDNNSTDGGTWTVTNPSGRLAMHADSEVALPGTINGTLNDSGGTHGMQLSNPSSGAGHYITYEWPNNEEKEDCSWGFWYTFPADLVGSDDEHDILYVENAFGANELYVKQTDHTARGSHLYLYTGESGYSSAIQIGGMPGERIWITAKLETGGSHRLRAYTAAGVQIGSEQTRTAHATEPSYQYSLGTAVGGLQGHSGVLEFDDLIVDWTTAQFPLIPFGAELTQEGFRWRADDGDEDGASWLDAQDANITRAVSQNTRLRILIDALDDPASAQFRLDYKLSTDGAYAAVPLVASGKVTPVIEPGDATTDGNNTATGTWNVARPTLATGDLLILILGWDDSTTTTGVTVANGPNSEVWQQINSVVASASTEVRLTAYYVVATGAWGAGTIAVTPSASEQWSSNVIKVPAGEFDASTPIGASNTRASSGTAETDALSPSLTAGSTDGSGKLVWAAAVDADPLTTLQSGNTQIAHNDIGAVAVGTAVRDTAVSNSESIAGGATWAIAGDSWCSLTFVVRAPTVDNPIHVNASANIGASGEATTAQLTAPSGKTTGDFVAGRIQDDENPADSVDIGTDEYTELEWCLTAVSGVATNGQVYQFRVTNNGTVLDNYDVTPEWTIGAPGGGISIPVVQHFRQRVF